MSAGEPNRYFEDLAVGEVLVSAARTVSEQEIIDFASKYDPQYFHMDPAASKTHPQFGRMVASGIHILALWRQLDHQITGDVRWICGIDWENLRWNKPMAAGDTVRARTEITGKRPSSSRADRGIVTLRYSVLNQDDEELVYFMSNNLVERKPAEQAAG